LQGFPILELNLHALPVHHPTASRARGSAGVQNMAVGVERLVEPDRDAVLSDARFPERRLLTEEEVGVPFRLRPTDRLLTMRSFLEVLLLTAPAA